MLLPPLHTHTHTPTCTLKHTHTYMHTQTHTPTCTHTHSHTHTHTQTSIAWASLTESVFSSCCARMTSRRTTRAASNGKDHVLNTLPHASQTPVTHCYVICKPAHRSLLYVLCVQVPARAASNNKYNSIEYVIFNIPPHYGYHKSPLARTDQASRGAA
jgi:hypothetical protein